jgi:DNA-binding CsgD family transcriptional regulator
MAAHGVRLTAREHEIVDLVGRGLSNAEIARRLGVEVSTVNSHVHHALQKSECRNRVELVAQYGSPARLVLDPGLADDLPTSGSGGRQRWIVAAGAVVAALVTAAAITAASIRSSFSSDGPVQGGAAMVATTPAPANTPVPTWAPGGGIPSANRNQVLPTPQPIFQPPSARFAEQALHWRARVSSYRADSPAHRNGQQSLIDVVAVVPRSGVPEAVLSRRVSDDQTAAERVSPIGECITGDEHEPAAMVLLLPALVDLQRLRAEGYEPGGALTQTIPEAPPAGVEATELLGTSATAQLAIWSQTTAVADAGRRIRTVAFDPESQLLQAWDSVTLDRQGHVVSRDSSFRSPVAMTDLEEPDGADAIARSLC